MQKRKAYALLLLGVILPALLLSSFHRHPAESFEDAHCVQCSDHVPHGHLSSDSHLSDCLLCHFLGLPYLPGLTQVLQDAVCPLALHFRQTAPDVCFQHASSLLMRGPPSIFRCAGL
ncbi:MAG: hypothetical protein IJ578_07515 [Bacteroidales bacterium]|nr:hypothetical protein [Bacteroidales bacterium]